MPSQTFFSSTTFAIPAGQTALTITCVGGGGSGGGSGDPPGGAGGGGGAAIAVSSYNGMSGEVLTITIGATAAGGAGGSPNGSDGTTGGDSQVSNATPTVLCKAKGGSGGGKSIPGNFGLGGAGGLAGSCVGNVSITAGTSGGNGDTTGGGSLQGLGGGGGSVGGGAGADSANITGSNGSAPYVTITYTTPNNYAVGTGTLFIGNYCADALIPSGDSGVTPSGYITNSIGTSGNFYSYINDNPYSSLTDNTYLHIYSSGVRTFPGVYYSTYDGLNNNLYLHNLTTNQSKALLSIPKSSGVIEQITHDFVNNSLYLGFNSYNIYRFDMENNIFSYDMAGYIKIFIDYFTNIKYYLSSNRIVGVNLDNSVVFSYNTPASTYINNWSQDVRLRRIYIVEVFAGSYFLRYIDTNTNTIVNCDYITRSNFNQRFDIGNSHIYQFDINNYIDNITFNQDTGVVNNSSAMLNIAPNSNATSFDLRLDTLTNELYYVSLSGASNYYLNRINIINSGINSFATSGNIECFDFGRDYFQQTADFTLTSTKPSFGGTSSRLVSNASVSLRAIENHSGTFISSRVLTSNNIDMWYPFSNVLSIWTQNSGEIKQTIGSQYTTINQNYNSRANWDTAKLRLNIFSIIKSGEPCNFDIKSAQVNIYCSGVFAPTSSKTNTFTLYCSGKNSITNSATLYTLGGTAYKQTALFIYSKSSVSGVPTLYIKSIPTKTNTSTLFINGAAAQKSTTLFMRASVPISGRMNLFLKAKNPTPFSKISSLFTFSSTSSGIYKKTSLYLKVQPASGQFNSNMNLAMAGVGSFKSTSSMNLFLKRDNYLGNPINTTSIFLKNAISGVNNTATIFICSPSGTFGAVPKSGTMNLFIQRASSNLISNTSLFINGPRNVTNTTPIYMNSRPSATGNPPLYVKGVGNLTSNSKLFIGGF